MKHYILYEDRCYCWRSKGGGLEAVIRFSCESLDEWFFKSRGFKRREIEDIKRDDLKFLVKNFEYSVNFYVKTDDLKNLVKNFKHSINFYVRRIK